MKHNETVGPKVACLHYDNLVCDYYPLALPLILDGEIEAGIKKKIAAEADGNSIVYDVFGVYLERLEAGGNAGRTMRVRLDQAFDLAGINCIVLTLGRPPKPMTDYGGILDHIAWWRRFAGVYDRLRICRDTAEARRAYSDGKVALMLALQEGGCLENDLQRIDSLHGEGVRIIQLTYNRSNTLGSGCAEAPEKGLTEFGREAVRRMNESGVIVDLSHCNYQTTLDGLRASRRPPAVTHSSCKAVFKHDRAKTDEELELLAEKDGYFGLYTVPAFLSADPNPGFDLFLKHLKHAIGIMGPGRIGIGSDWGLWSPDVPKELTEAMVQSAYKMGFSKQMKLIAGTGLEGMNDYTDWIRITEALVKAGFGDEQIVGFLGGNFFRFMERAASI